MREDIIRILSSELQSRLRGIEGDLNEIRLRTNRPMMIIKGQDEYYMAGGHLQKSNGTVLPETEIVEKEIYVVKERDIKETMELITNYSLYAYEEEVRQGYITVMGGHRVGICGRAVYDNGVLKTIRNIQSINIRVAHEVLGCGKEIFEEIYKKNGFENTLIFSKPGGGKTTLLRDLVRLLSDGDSGFIGKTVGVVDERSEIAACHLGKPQNRVGLRTDVLDCCRKADGMLMLVRSMRPEIIAVDEIGGRQDAESIQYCSLCGCKILATIHGNSLEELKRKKGMKTLLVQGCFRYLIQCDTLEGKHVYQVFNF
ncbi:MAG: stage III sporulation protein AA [Lachnospiraceae bacterium]